MYYSYYQSPIGTIKIEATQNEIVTVQFTNCVQSVDKPNEITPICEKQLREYFERKKKKFDIPLKLEGTEFQKKVWKELCKIPYGETVSYRQIAVNINNEKAVRAVGSAIGKNPIAIIVPCHRVIGTNGAMTGYAYGIEKKEKLLNLEKGIKA